MAYDGRNQQVVLPSTNPSPQTYQENGAKKRYRLGQGVPTNSIHPRENDSRLIFAKLHPSFKEVVLVLAFYVGASTLCFYLFEDQIKGKETNAAIDAMYFSIVTMATVGYGDLVPDSVATKLLACAFVFIGMALVGLILSKAADYLVEKQERLLFEALRIYGAGMVKEKKPNKVKYKLFMMLVLLSVFVMVGMVVLVNMEDMGVLDSFYCVCSTITTLGYGDKSFSTKVGRIFAVFWIPATTICLAQCLLYLAELSTEHRQKALVDSVLRRRITCLDLKEADLDHDGPVCAAEFVIYKLKEMGKISEDDISLIMEKFQAQDIDQSLTLTESDIALAESSQRKA